MIVDLHEHTREWLAWRNKHVGGSDAAAVMYQDPYKDRFQVWLEKTGRNFKGNGETFATAIETPQLKGIRLEPQARSQYCLRHGIFAPKHCFENDRPGETFTTASVDGCVRRDPGLVAEDKILEIKCPDNGRTHIRARANVVEEAHYIQMQHNMWVAGVGLADYISYFHGDLVVISVELDERFVTHDLVPTEAEFWDWVKQDSYPFPREEEVYDLADDIEMQMVLNSYLTCRQRREEVEAQEDALMGKLKQRLFRYGTIKGGGATLTWTRRRGNIQYRQLPEVQELLRSRVNLDQYRGNDSLSLRVDRE